MEPFAREIARRRTFAIIAHPDAGKTTLTEKLLLFGGAIQIAGAIKARKAARHATSDWMAVEQQRGISVTTSVMQFEYEDCVFNLLDTPGHQDFSEDTYRVLTAVDAAVMVIDAAKGVEAQTIKLLEVCRLRNTPIITFINKLDREVRDGFDLIAEIEDILQISCAPVTWPMGMGKHFRGVFHLLEDRMFCFAPGTERRVELETIVGLHNPLLDERFPDEVTKLREDVALAREALPPFALGEFLTGRQTPVFFGSAVNNFGVQDVLDALAAWAPPPQPRDAGARTVYPDEPKFTGFVFKIQANLDPKHRDRMAFLRVCSGRYTNGMKAFHTRLGREMRLANAVTFLANRRNVEEEAYPGDIIGIPNHGQLQIGDTLTEGELLQFTGIPYFAPELFRAARLKDPLRAKQLHKGLKELGEEGAIQVFEREGGQLILGAVGALQFEIVAERLKTEYQVEALFEPVEIYTVRWLLFPDDATKNRFVREQALRLGRDVDGNLVYLAPSRYNLELTQEKYPEVEFRATREHRQVFA
ncbi:MAG TPA: peptide chain release factor 3 [Hydrogenophilus thermoluteolus]|nr:peptide chain release factor 3 [Hydrogenophilus thermoluteolus]HNU19344.1 peptide chain release factor 3 [Hydrogenophilus thermoluteolus]